MRTLLLVTAFILIPLVSALGQQSITTLFDENNGLSDEGAGVFFDIENITIEPIIIVSWDINLECDDPPFSISVYSRAGTSQGFEGTMNGWTLVGTQTLGGCAGPDLPTALNIGGLVIEPGETTGIAMVFDTDGASWNYTNGTGDNQIYNNGELEIRTGSSYSPSFDPNGDINEPRVWNGTVYYIFSTRAIPTLSQWGLIAMAGVIGIVGLVVLKRRKAAV